MIKLIIALAAATAIVGCDSKRQPQSTEDVGGGYEVSHLFHHEGCDVYRFRDGGSSRYYTRCEAGVSTQWTESCGKSCTRHMDLPTLKGRP